MVERLVNGVCLLVYLSLVFSFVHMLSLRIAATDEARLRTEFSQFGAVTEVFLPVERGTSRPRGFGFVTLANRDAAERAITQMDQSQLDGVSLPTHCSLSNLWSWSDISFLCLFRTAYHPSQ